MFVDTPAEIAVENTVPGRIRAVAVKGLEKAVAASEHEDLWHVFALELWRGHDGEVKTRVRWSQSHQKAFSAGRVYEKLESRLRQEMAEEATSTDPEETGPFEAELLKREQFEMALELGRWQGSRQEPEEN